MTTYQVKVSLESITGHKLERSTYFSLVHARQSHVQKKVYQILPINGNDARELARDGKLEHVLTASDGSVKETVTYTLTKMN